MNGKRKILFVKYGGFSNVNEIVYEILTREFPSLEVEVIDLFSGVVNTKDLATIFHTIKEYGLDIFNRQINMASRRLVTNYFFNKLRAFILERFAERDYLFTF
ncbi:hypothetical protein [Chamaesiphon sp. GL140_3_metabinner_50]|uniref:hypothetical protein n=1 Tax=Chamaesiphon sp. GL140_3_metabinner_50 TaxID=2970812 RepID=UPI0025D4C7A2|nr:hypothetical protein [Chamaesiphon sp. GL140_3_metabinner_50]